MDHIHVRNWERFQQYKDREPRWIKLYRSLNRNYEWCRLSDKARAQLVGLWLLAAELDNKIPLDEAWIMQQISGKGQLALDELVTNGFVVVSENVQDCTEVYTEKSRVETEKSRVETEKSAPAPDFERFWLVYPRKTNRKRALSAWRNLSNTNRDRARTALPNHVAYWHTTKRPTDKIPHASTWLNGECWNDELPTVDAPQQVGATPDHHGMWSREDESKNSSNPRWSAYTEAMLDWQGSGDRPGFDEWRGAA